MKYSYSVDHRKKMDQLINTALYIVFKTTALQNDDETNNIKIWWEPNMAENPLDYDNIIIRVRKSWKLFENIISNILTKYIFIYLIST